MTWIPVNQQLPPKGEIVEARFNELEKPQDVYYDHDMKCWYFSEDLSRCIYTPSDWRKKQKQ